MDRIYTRFIHEKETSAQIQLFSRHFSLLTQHDFVNTLYIKYARIAMQLFQVIYFFSCITLSAKYLLPDTKNSVTVKMFLFF